PSTLRGLGHRYIPRKAREISIVQARSSVRAFRPRGQLRKIIAGTLNSFVGHPRLTHPWPSALAIVTRISNDRSPALRAAQVSSRHTLLGQRLGDELSERDGRLESGALLWLTAAS